MLRATKQRQTKADEEDKTPKEKENSNSKTKVPVKIKEPITNEIPEFEDNPMDSVKEDPILKTEEEKLQAQPQEDEDDDDLTDEEDDDDDEDGEEDLDEEMEEQIQEPGDSDSSQSPSKLKLQNKKLRNMVFRNEQKIANRALRIKMGKSGAQAATRKNIKKGKDACQRKLWNQPVSSGFFLLYYFDQIRADQCTS